MDEIIKALGAFAVVLLVLGIIAIIANWKIYEKAGQPGWASIVPFYNTYVLIVNILKMQPVWFWLLLVPFLGFAVAIALMFMIPFKLAEKFGKDAGFAVGLLLIPFIFYPILAFGGAQYVGAGRRSGGGRGSHDDDEDDDRRKW